MSRLDRQTFDDQGRPFPPIDERLAPVEQPYEVWDGELVRVSPASPAHAKLHASVLALLEAHVTRRYKVFCDMLTRVSIDTDIAPDIAVCPAAKDRKTGGRKLEELAFEIVSTSRLGKTGKHAARLARRGVRRVFALDVKRGRALEWSTVGGAWLPLDPAGDLRDRTLAAPLPIAALIRAGVVDDQVARALLAKRNSVIQAVRAKDRAAATRRGIARGVARGRAQALGQAVVDVLEARGISSSQLERKRIVDERDARRLRRWLRRAATCEHARELFATR
jgi:hypothetical protein